MAAATDSALGTVILKGGDLLSTDATSPELVPTGVTPGDYNVAGVYVDQKGRTLYAKSITEVDIPCATTFTCGLVAVGNNITLGADSEISIPLATTTNKGVVKIGTGFSMDGCVLNLDYPIATSTTAGLVIVPTANGLSVAVDGALSVDYAGASSKGTIEVPGGDGLVLTTGVLTLDASLITNWTEATSSTIGFIYVPGGDGLNVDANGALTISTSFKIADNSTPPGVVKVPTGQGLYMSGDELWAEIADSSTLGLFYPGTWFSVVSEELSLSLPDATPTSEGGVTIGSSLIDEGSGAIGVADATDTTKGIFSVSASNGLSVTAGDVTYTRPDATSTIKGLVSIGDNISVSAGHISVPVAESDTTFGVVVEGTNTTILSGELNLGSDVPSLASSTTWAKTQSFGITELTPSGITAGYTLVGKDYLVNLTKNLTMFNPTSGDGKQWTIVMKQDSVGGRTITWESNFVFPNGVDPQPYSGANTYTVYKMWWADSSNSTIYCVPLRGFE